MLNASVNALLTGTWQVAVGVPLLLQPVELIEKLREAVAHAPAVNGTARARDADNDPQNSSIVPSEPQFVPRAV